uniref:Uncharacterized protein n=1 Tax=Anopheles melas TaxID=34690 RepID=A0A182UCS1_9DIPT
MIAITKLMQSESRWAASVMIAKLPDRCIQRWIASRKIKDKPNILDYDLITLLYDESNFKKDLNEKQQVLAAAAAITLLQLEIGQIGMIVIFRFRVNAKESQNDEESHREKNPALNIQFTSNKLQH